MLDRMTTGRNDYLVGVTLAWFSLAITEGRPEWESTLE
jgi:hypothetical protein